MTLIDRLRRDFLFTFHTNCVWFLSRPKYHHLFMTMTFL